MTGLQTFRMLGPEVLGSNERVAMHRTNDRIRF
jgi:hypothetical protein